MKRTILLVLVVSLALGSAAFAAPAASTGGYLYWNTWTGIGTSSEKINLFRQQIGANWSNIGNPVNFDNVPVVSTYSWPLNGERNRNVEGYVGGKLLVAAPYNRTPGNIAVSSNTIPWDVLVVDPNVHSPTYSIANGNMLTDGRLWTSDAQWSTRSLSRVIAAPANWGGVNSGNVSLLGLQSSGTPNVIYNANYFYDLNGANGGYVDNALSKGQVAYSSAGIPRESEFGPDGALYTLYGVGALATPSAISIIKTWWNGSAFDCAVFLSGTGKQVIGGSTDCPGLAIGGTASNPIVYLAARDNVSSTYRSAIFALQDKDHNGIMSWDPAVDCITKVWRRGDATIGYGVGSAFSDTYMNDVEVDNDGKHSYLIFNDYYYGTGMFQLADNGVAGVANSGVTFFAENNTNNYGPHGYGSGFEFITSVPEPVSVTLAGGAAAAFVAWWRRRRTR